ncbi:hypothetical protein MBLNU457_3914t1 [Dothideomycetes sp. NU457]
MGVIGGACLGLIALFFPPFPVLVRTGCSVDFLISIILTFLGWLPGVIYAWYIILAYPSGTYRREHRRQPTTYDTTSHHRHHHHKRRHSRDYDYDYPPTQPAYAHRPAAAQGMYAAPPASAYGVPPPPAYSYAPPPRHSSSRY